MDLPSRMIVIESAICSISLSLWEIMMRADAPALEAADEVEQVLGVGLVQRRGGLVEDEQLDRLVQRLGDLDQLLLADADVLDLGVRVLAQPHPGEQLDGARAGLGPVDDAAPGRLVAEEDVLGDRQLRDQREFLVDDHDAGVLAGADVLELAGPRPGRRCRRRRCRTGRRPESTFISVDLPAPFSPQMAWISPACTRDGDVGERLDARELLGDGAHLEDDWAAGRHDVFASGTTSFALYALQCMTSLSATCKPQDLWF